MNTLSKLRSIIDSLLAEDVSSATRELSEYLTSKTATLFSADKSNVGLIESYDVFIVKNGEERQIDTIYVNEGDYTAEELRTVLIEEDNFNRAIIVRKAPSLNAISKSSVDGMPELENMYVNKKHKAKAMKMKKSVYGGVGHNGVSSDAGSE